MVKQSAIRLFRHGGHVCSRDGFAYLCIPSGLNPIATFNNLSPYAITDDLPYKIHYLAFKML